MLLVRSVSPHFGHSDVADDGFGFASTSWDPPVTLSMIDYSAGVAFVPPSPAACVVLALADQ
jgi:hypothetical protein